MPNSAVPASTGIMPCCACACRIARTLLFSVITLAIAGPAEFVYEPDGVVTMLTVCATAGPISNGTARSDAARTGFIDDPSIPPACGRIPLGMMIRSARLAIQGDGHDQ